MYKNISCCSKIFLYSVPSLKNIFKGFLLRHYICEYTPEIYVPLDDNDVSTAEGRARSFDTLNPNSHYSQICGRKFVRKGRIVGGNVASYAEWPWQVSLRQVSIASDTKYFWA